MSVTSRIDWRSKDDWTLETINNPNPSVGPMVGSGQQSRNGEYISWDVTPEGARIVRERRHELVETTEEPCLDGSRLLRCQPGRTTRTEKSITELDEHRFPRSRVILSDGQVVGLTRFLSVDWR